ncbi:hypothetical protein BRADI_3g07988v3 [Brachypodium distachyon]|uniref:Myb-like domain-containing protein n=1 Tax=Brachypodium distachyon TaxID=15368 RepID=A0A0Q3J7B7_BRADI|nr:hypothetical protein BRADI_3g07988v3 [Brachypodium distachyon]PNT66166.1 hypothetical protein BRADI_3g07988v3 [Brachypodium distachyon]
MATNRSTRSRSRTGGSRVGSSDSNAGSSTECCSSSNNHVMVTPRRSPRFASLDPEHPIVLDKECKVGGNQSALTPLQRSARLHRGDKSPSKLLVEKGSYLKQLPLTQNPRVIAHNRKTQSAITPLRRSARFHQGDMSPSKLLVEKGSYLKQLPLTPNPRVITHNRKTQTIVNKDKRRENPTRSSQRIAALKASARMKTHKEPRTLFQDSQDVPPRKKTADASYSMSEMQQLKPSYCEDLTRKRKRGTERKPTSRKLSHQEPKSGCQKIAPITETRNIIRKKSENDPSSIMEPKISDDTLMNTKECKEEPFGIKRGVEQQLCASDHWTEEQDLTLRQAYFTARPSPHFWKKVSKMVPGKSAEECFNRVHADLSTPTPIAPRPRASKTQFSPLGHFTLSDPKFPNLLEPLVGRQRTAKQKSLAAQKTVRHLLKKHSLIDQAQEADHFSVFETSPSALQLNIPLEDCPGTPDNYLNSCALHKGDMSSRARKRPLSRLKTKQDEPSPAVLKPVKNAILHEKYINQLSRREEGAKKPRKKAAGTNATDPERPVSGQQAGGLRAAKDALISEATDFICQFKKSQANSLAHLLENSEDDEDNCNI